MHGGSKQNRTAPSPPVTDQGATSAVTKTMFSFSPPSPSKGKAPPLRRLRSESPESPEDMHREASSSLVSAGAPESESARSSDPARPRDAGGISGVPRFTFCIQEIDPALEVAQAGATNAAAYAHTITHKRIFYTEVTGPTADLGPRSITYAKTTVPNSATRSAVP